MGRVGDTITLSEASRFGRSTAFSLMLKPVGSRCNLHCSYCYYLDKSFLYGGSEPLMSLPLLERCIRDFCASCDLPELTVEWHGGEPLLAGMDFFRNALAFEKKYSGGRPVHNTLQTNGTLLNADWASFSRTITSSSGFPSTDRRTSTTVSGRLSGGKGRSAP